MEKARRVLHGGLLTVEGLQRGLDGFDLVATNSISLAFPFGESSFIALWLLSPQSLRDGFAGALFAAAS